MTYTIKITDKNNNVYENQVDSEDRVFAVVNELNYNWQGMQLVQRSPIIMIPAADIVRIEIEADYLEIQSSVEEKRKEQEEAWRKMAVNQKVMSGLAVAGNTCESSYQRHKLI